MNKPQQRDRPKIENRLAVCTRCTAYTPKRVGPELPNDGYCDDLACRLAARGLVAYIRRTSSSCPRGNWARFFRTHTQGAIK